MHFRYFSGTSLVDVVFILAVALITQSINCGLESAGLDHGLSTPRAMDYFGLDGDDFAIFPKMLCPAWVDDLVVPFIEDESNVPTITR